MSTFWFEFTEGEIRQIESHIERSQREGVYYGNREQYVKRDTRIMNELIKRRSKELAEVNKRLSR
jgi:hypothetical protein